MKREPLLRMLRDKCERAGLAFRIEKSEGKGSHYRVYAGSRNTIVKSGDLTPLYMQIIRMQIIRKQLDLR